MLVLPFPDIHPVALSLGPFSVKWYGLAYMAGLLLGWLYVRRLLATVRFWPGGQAPFSVDKADDLLLYMTLGVVLGGRLGEVLFYSPGYFLQNPMEIFAVWKGGMSFHGGFIGSIVAIALFAWRNGVDVRTTLDLAAAATPIGLFFGRIANFINSELWGRPSSVPWSFVFPHREAGDVPRHPSQLYEAGLEGLVLAILCWWLIYHRDALRRPGLVAGVFTAGYGVARSFCEVFREPEIGHALNLGPITAGILYSIPMIAIGLYFIWQANRRALSPEPVR
jgi:phosphatidylglycerol---prolipoprotein diacylglyceryl transferase